MSNKSREFSESLDFCYKVKVKAEFSVTCRNIYPIVATQYTNDKELKHDLAFLL